jgi:VWFA-related protein
MLRFAPGRHVLRPRTADGSVGWTTLPGRSGRWRAIRAALIACATLSAAGTLAAQRTPSGSAATQEVEPRFRSRVDLINVTATVSSEGGRSITGLTRDDFLVYEDDRPQELTYFSADRVPVSLGIVLDTSGSMAGEKFDDARNALDRFTLDLLDRNDEVFLYRFSDQPILVQGWTTDSARLSQAMSRIAPNGGTAMYDAVFEALPLAEQGIHPKKALVIISDGNDTSSNTYLGDLIERIRSSEVLVYAIGIDGVSAETFRQPPNRPRLPAPTPFPPGRRPGGRFPVFPQIFGPGSGRRPPTGRVGDDRVNERALRDLTDSSGGRTAIIRSSRDLKGATADIAEELGRQYSLGYVSSAKRDGRWHAIRVEVRSGRYRVRARQGFVAN